jgi:hypothetical protein
MSDRFTADKLAWLEKVATTPGPPGIAYQLAVILGLKFVNREQSLHAVASRIQNTASPGSHNGQC